MSRLTCCVQLFCTEKPGSSSSWVTRRLSWPLPPIRCPHIKQLGMGALAAPCVHSHMEPRLSPAPSFFSLAYWL
ncbi:unnamed protein product [Staurois parvus]|uniref:Uncharacterized protein n=1 Tax=Staurois parvus TaxID=386267 RepID=A0ABN9DM30_9NEOB|nr:unnamed protein product [Staurois parvus]